MKIRALVTICALLSAQIDIHAKPTDKYFDEPEKHAQETDVQSGFLSPKAIAATVLAAAAVAAVVIMNTKDENSDPNLAGPGFSKFSNPSNTCFINATLHGIFSSQAHRAFLDAFDRTHIPADAHFLHTFFALFDDYTKYAAKDVTLPLNKNYAFAKLVPALFNLNSTDPFYLNHPVASTNDIWQQDAGEFYIKLTDALNTFDHRLGKTTITTTRVCTPLIVDIVPHLRTKTEHLTCLQLEIPDQEAPISISTLLARFETPELIDNVECAGCDYRNQATKTATITPSSHLVINLKRTQFNPATGALEKVRTPLTVEKVITLHGQALALTGVAFHIGTKPKAGHWVALIKPIGSDDFHFFNDAQLVALGATVFPALVDPAWVNFTRPHAVEDSHELAAHLDASLLFYERVNHAASTKKGAAVLAAPF